MNGQQLTNSSNSANGTPSSSYPASLSSQSSRDPSPALGPGPPRKTYIEPYNHILNAQANHWAGDKGTEHRETPPPIQPPLEKQGLSAGQKSIHPQPMSQPLNQAPSSQPTHRFPPPTSLVQPHFAAPQNNHIPPGQFPTSARPTYPNAQPEPSRSNQSPLQSAASQFQKYSPAQSAESQRSTQSPLRQPTQFQPSSFQPPPTSVPNPLPKTSPVPFQQQPNLFPKMPPQAVKQSQPVSHVSHTNQIPQQNKFSQPSQISQPQPPITTTQPQRFPQTTQPQVSQPLSHTPQNMFSQAPNLSQPPVQNAFYQQPKMTQGPNQMQQPQTNLLPPKKRLNQPPNQSAFSPPIQAPNAFTQPPRPNQPQTLLPQNKFAQGPVAPPSQYGQVPNQFHGAPTQTAPPPSQYPPMSQPPNNYPQQQPQQFAAPPQNYQQQPNNQFNKRYPQMPQQGGIDGLTPMMNSMSVKQGFNALWGMDTVDLLQCRDLLPSEKIEPPSIRLPQELYNSVNCSPEIFRATLSKIPETKSLLDKSRLPLGVLIHPFKDLNQLSVIQCTVIVRCRMCRTYINPFVFFVDNKRWKCNLCFRVNELPEEFQFDPMSKTYGDPSRRPEIKSATIEFIAPSEYMVRPPQPAVYVFVFDVSRLACESGYLSVACRTLLAELDNIPGDARTSVAFITYDSAVHFYALTEGQAQPHQMIVVDIDDVFLPTPDNLLVNLSDCRELVRDLLTQLPNKFHESYDTHSAMGAALQAAYKLLAPTGGRVSVFQTCLPNTGPGSLSAREDPAQRAGDNPPHLNPATDFYKKLALDCSGQQIAVDLFILNSQYVDLATLSGVSRFSGGCIHHVPLFRADKPLLVESLERMFQRYLTRKIGLESVMRLRCTRGLAIHTFHGNFFVRSTDLLSLPNANPDAGFGMQVTIEENLSEVHNICFQAALLYTSSKGERRIRVHTLCLPVASNLADILHGADQQCIAGLLAKMAVDRAVQSSLPDAREAFLNVVADVLSAYRLTQSSGSPGGCLLAPSSLQLLPLYILALLKHMAFRVGQSTRLDDRVMAMCQMKSLPLTFLMQSIYPDLYPLLNIEHQPELEGLEEVVHMPPHLQLSAERIDSLGMFLMDDGVTLLIYVGHNLDPAICRDVFNVPHFSAIPHELYSLPVLENPTSEALRNFINYLQNEKPYPLPLEVIRDDSHHRIRFLERLVEDKNESGTSYHEFLQRVKAMTKN